MTVNYIKDTGYAWIIVAAAFLVNFITDGLVCSSGIMFVELLDVFGESRGYTGAVGALLVGTMYLIGPVVAALTQRLNIRFIIVGGSLLSSAGIVASYFATSILFLCVSMGVLGGAGLGMMYTPSSLCVFHAFDKRLSVANGLSVCGSAIGTVLFTKIMPILFEIYGLRGTMLILSGIVLNGVVLALLLQPANADCKDLKTSLSKTTQLSLVHTDTPNPCSGTASLSTFTPVFHLEGETAQKKGDFGVDNVFIQQLELPNKDDIFTDQVKNKETTDESNAPNSHSTKWLTTKLRKDIAKGKCLNICGLICNSTMVRNARFWMFIVSTFMFISSIVCVLTLLPDQVELSGMSKTQSSWLMSAIGICNATGRVISGLISNATRVKRLYMLVMIILVGGVITIASSWMRSFEAKLLYAIVYGCCIGGYMTLVLTIQVDMFGEKNVPYTFGWFMFTVGLAGLLSAPIGGMLYDITGEYNVTFVVYGTLPVLAGVTLGCTKCANSVSSRHTCQELEIEIGEN